MNIREVNDDFFKSKIAEYRKSGEHEKADEWETFYLNLHQNRKKDDQYNQEQMGRFLEKIDTPATHKCQITKEIEAERDRRRSRVVEIFSELLDEELLERRASGIIYDHVKRALQHGAVLEVEISTCPYGITHPWDFDLPAMTKSRCFKSHLVFFVKQTRYMDVDLKDWHDWLKEYGSMGTYGGLEKDILDASKQFQPWLEEIRSRGFQVNVNFSHRLGRTDAPRTVVLIR